MSPPTEKLTGGGPRVSKPELELDRTVTGADKQRRFDEPRRRSTLTNFPGSKLPPLGAPGLPLDYRPTTPASALTAPTLPAKAETTGIRFTEDETTPRSRVDGPPLSATPEQASNVALRARAEAAEAKTAELERRERVRQETRQASYPPAKIDRSPTPPVVSIPPDGSVASLRKAITRLILGVAALLALLGTPLAIWVSNVAAEAKARSERASAQVAQASTEADAAKAKASTNAKDAAATEREFRQFRSNMRELMRLQGVEIPKNEGDPEPADLKPYAPLCPAGKVCTGPQLILTRCL